jgi:hypothetical protein
MTGAEKRSLDPPVFKDKINQGSVLRDKKDVEGGEQSYKRNAVLKRQNSSLNL